MERKISEVLSEWKSKEGHKPLILRGARQVGKTYSIREFGLKNYSRMIELNFDEKSEYKTLFEYDRSADTFYNRLGFEFDIDSFDDCLLFFDEIQSCPGALSALKHLCIDGRCDIICSGSLLGNIVDNTGLLPLGYVETQYMNPMDFEEFLWAMGFSHDKTDIIRDHVRKRTPFDRFVLRKLNDLFKRYVTIGGMPESVLAYSETGLYRNSFDCLRNIQDRLFEDVAKYATSPIHRLRIEQCIESIPVQLSRESGNSFKYSEVSQNRGYGSREYFLALDWLKNAGIIKMCHNLEEISEPFRIKSDGNTFKVYMSDTGVLTMMLGPGVAKGIIEDTFEINNGAIMENAIAQSLVSKGYTLHYFSSTSRRMEVDFVINLNGTLTAIEVKSGRKKSSKSLNKALSEDKAIGLGMKVSDSNISVDENGVLHLPFFGPAFLEDCHPLEPRPIDYLDDLKDRLS